MRTIRWCGLDVLVVASVVAGPLGAQVPIPAQPAIGMPLVLRGVTVIDVRAGRRLANQQVEIVGNRIHAIVAATLARLPRDARIVDARGKYLIPGLWDMHSHSYGYTELALLLDLANGVTGIRDLGSPVPLETLGEWKREIAAGQRLGPRLIVSGPHLSKQPIGQGKFGVHHVGDSTVEGIRRLVDSLHAAGADLIKTYFLDRKLYFAAAAEARRLGMMLGGHGIDDDGHWNSGGTSGLMLSDSGATLLDHEAWLPSDPCGNYNRDSLNMQRCAKAGRHFRQNGTWIVLTPSTPAHPVAAVDRLRYAPTERLRQEWLQRESFRSGTAETSNLSRDSLVTLRRLELSQAPAFRLEFRYVPPTSTADWKAYLRRAQASSLIPASHLARWRELLRFLPVVLGTDYGPQTISSWMWSPGFGIHEGLVGEVVGGMSPLEALRTATRNPALALRLSDSLGTVEAGKVADLVLLDADPLDDIWNTTKIRAVVANGRYYDRAALDGVLAEAERVAARP